MASKKKLDSCGRKFDGGGGVSVKLAQFVLGTQAATAAQAVSEFRRSLLALIMCYSVRLAIYHQQRTVVWYGSSVAAVEALCCWLFQKPPIKDLNPQPKYFSSIGSFSHI